MTCLYHPAFTKGAPHGPEGARGYRDDPGSRERIIDITTTGRRTGRPGRIEVFSRRAAGRTYLFSGPSGRPTSWYANLVAHPDFTFHLKHGIRQSQKRASRRARPASPSRRTSRSRTNS
ncbi:nitroreductase/quinone reductase family protein [Streptomyces globisporus]|uniref:nitroreductase/quinone reductase family protein n=1 Tax=Streptomyces globisporus TaxID=1908 RepID=UPI0036849F15